MIQDLADATAEPNFQASETKVSLLALCLTVLIREKRLKKMYKGKEEKRRAGRIFEVQYL